MANARASALAARRTGSLYGGGGIKILAPVSTGISSIAKQNAASETDIMIAKYNAGLIGNPEMKAFLQAQLTNQYVSAADKVQIQTKLLDFDNLIEKDRLEAVFQSAPENSLQKVQAATALAEFYNARAATMQTGTQAQSQALQNAASWTQQAQAVQDSANKEQRKNVQNSMLVAINQKPNSSEEKAMARAGMYKTLYEMAIKQGDVADAQVYQANMNQELSNAQAYAETEAKQETAANRKQIINEFNKTRNAYLTKQISYEDYKSFLQGMVDYAYQSDDGAMLNTVTTAATEMEKLNTKGGPGAVGLGGGLFAKVKSTGGGSGQSQADIDAQNYSDDIRLFQEAYARGKDAAGIPYGEDRYKADMKEAVAAWQGNLQAQFDEVASMDPNATVWWNNKKRKAGDVIDEIQNELNKVNGMDYAIDNGTAVLFGVPPTEQIGKNTPKFELRDTRFLSEKEKGLIAQDESGIAWIGEMGQEEVPVAEYQKAKLVGQDDNYSYDKNTGKAYVNVGLRFNIVDPVTGQVYRQKPDEEGKLISPSKIREEAASLGYGEKDIIDFNPEKAQAIRDSGETRWSMTPEEYAASKKRQLIETNPGMVKPALGPGVKVETPQSKNPLGEAKIATPLPTTVTDSLGQLVPGLTSNTPGVKNAPTQMQSTPAPVIRQSTPTQIQSTPTFVYGGQSKPPVAPTIQSVPKTTQPVYQSIPTPPKVVAPAPAPKAPSIGTIITGAAGQAFNKLKSLFKW